MGNCLKGNERQEPQQVVQSIETTKNDSTTQSIGLSNDSSTKSPDKQHARRHTSTKGMTRLTMKFPHIRYSFRACKRVFDEAQSEQVSTAEVRPLLVKLGASVSILDDAEIERITQTANLDGDNGIDFREFLIAAAIGCFLHDKIDHTAQSEEFQKVRRGFMVAKEAFDFIDTDKSGEIDFDELKKAFSAMKSDDETVKARFEELDFNKDKNIEFPEFVYGITVWVGMDEDGDDDFADELEEDENAAENAGGTETPQHRLSLDTDENPNKDDSGYAAAATASNPTDE